MIKVFKFGGFSVSTSENVKHLASIISQNGTNHLLIIVSAMGKTTDALEKLCAAFVGRSKKASELLEEIKKFHEQLITELFQNTDHPIFDDISNTFIEIEWMLEDEPHPNYDFNYDQIVSIGELVSSKIISAYLKECGLENKWLDARSFIHTDNTYREGLINREKTADSIRSLKADSVNKIFISQGFIGGTSENYTTTLGREGSDYSAAVFASALQAESLTVWKDVPGLMNADPALFSSAKKYHELPYSEALELAYYGANIIHPKTIKPLHNAGIPLFVRSFLQPEENGTKIHKMAKENTDFPAIIVKKNQVLLKISTKDFSYMDENHLSWLFDTFFKTHIKLNMMSLSALSISVCFDQDSVKLKKVTDLFVERFQFTGIEDLELLTVLYYKQEDIKKLSSGKTIIMEQFSKNKAQLIMQKSE